MLRLLVIAAATWGLASGLMAAESRIQYNPLTVAVNKGDQVQIRGFNGRLRLVADERLTTLTVKVVQDAPSSPEARRWADEWQFTVQREGSVHQIRVHGPVSRENWAGIIMARAYPVFHVELAGPSLPAEIHWGEGPIQIEGWQASLLIASQGGDVSVVRGQGDLKVFIDHGQVAVKDHAGSAWLETYAAKVNAENVGGSLDLENFSGESLVNGVAGFLKVTAHRGATRLRGAKGGVEFDNGRSPLSIENFAGELRGHTDQGSVDVTWDGEADVRVRSKDGAVSLHPLNSGARVNLGTVEGKFFVPTYLESARLPNLELRQGQLRGPNKGQIFVRTESGNIKIR